MMPRNSSPVIEKEIICTYKIKLEKVLGVTVPSNAALASDNGIVAYPAGCTVVLFNTRTQQQNHIINTSRRTITSLAYSSCGRYIVTGECGHQPAVRVWDLQSDPQSVHPGLAPQPQQIAEFMGHKYGVNCVSFSPNNKYVVSVGTQHDMIVNLWDWRNNIKVASNKVSTKVKAIAFAENGSYFVTVGNRHVKFWFLDSGKNKYKEVVPLMGRSAILGEQRNNYFCDVACGKGECGNSTYAITRSGFLCEFNNRRILDRWVELRTTSANCITVGEKYIFVGCAEGIIRCFDPSTLVFITTLPRCHYLGVDVTLGTSIQHMASPPPDAKYPDTMAVTFDETNHKLTAVYNDHSVYIWDVFNIKRVGKSFSFLFHSACIWGVEMAPPNSPFPPGSFLTCSSDDTIRVWTLDKTSGGQNSRGIYQQNIYSNELLKVVYVDKDLSFIKDLDISGTVGSEKQTEQTSYDGKNGVRCIRISPDGKHLASGDRSGNIRVHDTSQMKEQCKIEAHDSEVLCLEYSANDSKHSLLASASRDRLIHVFDTKSDYDFVQTLDDHSSSITAVRFLSHPNNQIQMVSCGADKSLIFRSLADYSGKIQFNRDNNATGKTTLYDMEVDTGQKHVLTACQDRNVRIYNVNTGKHTKTFKGSTGDDGTLIKVVLDRSGIYLATSCTDKSLSVYDYYSGECMATMCGHSELATGLRFTNDCRRLISASGDGCIFVWRIPHDMVVTMQARLSQQAMRHGRPLESGLFQEGAIYEQNDTISNVDPNYRFSIGQLPKWAKKQLTDVYSPPTNVNKGVAAPKGRWAQRAENTMGGQAFYGGEPLQEPNIDKRFDSDGSKDSSLDSGTEVKMYQETKKETLTTRLSQNVTIRDKTRRGIMTDDSAIGDVESVAHDGDLDSDSEYRSRPIYYPSLASSPGGSEFTVTNVDADELRKSQRKKKIPNIMIQQATTGNYDSEDDDDGSDCSTLISTSQRCLTSNGVMHKYGNVDFKRPRISFLRDQASTPSGDATDRNPMSLFSVSSESLDQIVNRERYLQSTFESMSGTEVEHHSPSNKSSFSSKFLTGSGGRGDGSAIKQTRNDPEALKKRQELSKRIAETKKKLESVGHSSPLRYSQSIHDLSHIPEKDKWSRKQEEAVDCCSTNTPTNTATRADATCNVCSSSTAVPSSKSVPVDLQLCGCYMSDIEKNTSGLNQIFDSGSKIGSKITQFLNLSPLTSSRLFDSESQKFRDSLEQATKSPEKSLNEFIRPRKLKLDKTLTKYKLHKSLPVSPVSEERQFADYVEQKRSEEAQQRQSFSYFLDFDSKSTDEGFKQICSDIEKFSHDFSKEYDQIEKDFPNKDPENTRFKTGEEEDSNFSSDSLEDYNFFSHSTKRTKKTVPPRRCVSNNEIYRYQEEYIEEIPKSESFFLNQNYSARGSQESILSDENNLEYDCYGPGKSYCNSLESVISNESDCKSAPLEVLFEDQRKQLISDAKYNMPHSQSLPKNISAQFEGELSSSLPKNFVEHVNFVPSSSCQNKKVESQKCVDCFKPRGPVKTCQTQTDFETPQEIVAKKSRGSEDFQKKLLKFESGIAQVAGKRPVAFFVESSSKSKTPKSCKENVPLKHAKNAKIKNDNMDMCIPSLAQKNKQYKSKFCNVLNNKPDQNLDIFEEKGYNNSKNNGNSFTLSTVNFEKNVNRNNVQETSSLDRHLFAKGLLNNSEKITHKPPKAVRRHSSKNRKGKTTYEYIRKEDFYKNNCGKSDGNKILNNRKREFQELVLTGENTIELCFKEKHVDMDVEASASIVKSNFKCGNVTERDYFQKTDRQNTILTELYDSLDKKSPPSRMDLDSLDVNLNNPGQASSDTESTKNLFDSLEINVLWSKNASLSKNTAQQVENVLKKRMEMKNEAFSEQETVDKLSPQDKIAAALHNIKILNEIQRKIQKINTLVDIYKKNLSKGKVKALSSMYESMTTSQSYYNDLTKLQATPVKFRRRNLSLPCFVERRLNFECKNVHVKGPNKNDGTTAQSGTLKRDEAAMYVEDASSPESSLRRSCSLSDLSMQNAPAGAQPKKKHSEPNKKPAPPARITPRYVKNNSMMRSKSSVVLNQQSDSENDSQDKKMSRLMRPTISSNNKMNQKSLHNRKKQSYSTSNINQIGIDNVSTSEDEDVPKKPQVPPRMSRQQSFENGQSSRKYMTNKESKRTTRHSIHFDVDETLTNDDFDLSSESVDLSSIEFSNQLCEDVSRKLVSTADNVARIYQKLRENEDAGDPQPDALDCIKMSLIKTHKVVHDCIFNELKQNNGNMDVNQTDAIKKLHDLVSKGASGSGSVIDLMQQYSDILLDIMQQKIHSANI